VRMGQGKARVELNCPTEIAHRLCDVPAVSPGQEVFPGDVCIIGLCARRRTTPGSENGIGTGNAQGQRDRPCDLVLDLQQIGRGRLVGLRPEIEPFAHVHQFSGHSNATSGSADGALENGPDAQLLSHVDRVGLTAVAP